MANRQWSLGETRSDQRPTRWSWPGQTFERVRTAVLGHALLSLRWLTILTLLTVTLIWPMSARSPLQTWHLILAFAVYSALAQFFIAYLAQSRRRPEGTTILAVFDVVVIGALYALGGALHGPVIALAVLAAIMVSTFMSPVHAVLYTVALCVSVTIATTTLPGWTGSQSDIQMLGGQLIILAIAGIGMRLLMAQVTEGQRQTRLAATESARLLARDTARAAFVSTVSHELRTPLTAAQAGLGLLDASGGARLTMDERELLANSRRNVDRLGRLITDLLTLNQIETGTLRLQPARLDLRDVVRSATTAIRPLVTSRGQSLTMADNGPMPMIGDRERLEQVLLNLLSNAHRHTANGSMIEVEARSTATSVVVTVADDGPGLSPEEIRAVLHPRGPAGPAAGTGLGLAIATSLVELHRGRISAARLARGGMTFQVEFPRCTDDGAA